MKIPTLLGVALIITLIALVGLYYYYTPKAEESSVEVTDLKVVNITDSSVSVVWQTSLPSVGQVLYGQSESNFQSADDIRDRGFKRARMVHFVTLNNLKPGAVYKYKISNDNLTLLPKALEFKTAKAQNSSNNQLDFSFPKPLKGTILNADLNPVDESLIFLEIDGAQTLATFSSTAGNFILPLKTVFNKQLDKVFVIPTDTKAKLKVIKGALKSEVSILISGKTINLPPITLGSNLNLENYESQPINQITFSTIPAIGSDFNNDQKVNSLDLALLKEAASSGVNTQSNFDINKDGIVDLDDVNEFSRSLNGN